MAVSITHGTVATAPNDETKEVSSNAWNAGHTVSGLGDAAEKNVGTGAGDVAAGDAPAAAVTTHEASAGVHAISAVTGLQDALDGKAAAVHTHDGLAPTGGTTGQVLKKVSDTNFDYAWDDDETSEGGAAAWGDITGTLANQTDLNTALGLKAPLASPTFTGTVAGITKSMVGLGNVDNTTDAGKPVSTAQQTALDLKANLASPTFTGTVAGITKSMVGLGNVDNTTDAGKPVSTAQQTALDAKQATLVSGTNIKTINGSSVLGSGDLTVGASLTSTSAFATATTSISAATYADITGCSVSLAAGTWLIIGQVVVGAVNAITQAFVAITHSDNTVISETAASRPASGTASLASPFTVPVFGIVSPGSTTTYKLRAARGLTTHTATYTVMDGNGVNTTNHATNNTDKGTGIFAVKIA